MRSRTVLITALTLAFLAQPSLAALNAYLRLTGDTQEEIKGGVTQAGREDSIMVIGFSHEITAPRDAASGLPTGKRQHKPITITKEIDKATPLLMNSLITGETLNGWIDFYEPSSAGGEVQFYTIDLRNAQVVSIRQEMLNNKYPENMQHKEREHVSFTYGAITRTIRQSKEDISSSDEWAYEPAAGLVSDVNGDGFVNFRDLAIMATEWAEELRF